MFALLVLLSQKQDPSRNESYNLIKMCKCVDYFWWSMDELLLPDSFSLCYFQSWAINIFFDMPLQACGIPSLGMHLFSFLFFFFFDILHEHVVYLLWVDIFYFCFCIAQVALESRVMEFLFLWSDGCGDYLPVGKYSMCTWSWSIEHDKSLTGVEEFDKTQSKGKQHLNVEHENLSLALVGIHDNLRSQAIFILTFEKENKCFYREEHDAIKPSHISLINYLESMGSL